MDFPLPSDKTPQTAGASGTGAPAPSFFRVVETHIKQPDGSWKIFQDHPILGNVQVDEYGIGEAPFCIVENPIYDAADLPRIDFDALVAANPAMEVFRSSTKTGFTNFPHCFGTGTDGEADAV